MFIKEYVLYPVLQYYLGYQIQELREKHSEYFSFETSVGLSGQMRYNTSTQNWDVCINETLIEEIEGIVLEVFIPSKEPHVADYYKALRKLFKENISDKSKKLVKNVMISLEESILTQKMRLETPITIEPFFVFNLDNQKQVIVLN